MGRGRHRPVSNIPNYDGRPVGRAGTWNWVDGLSRVWSDCYPGLQQLPPPLEKAMPLQLIADSGWQLFAMAAFALALVFVFFLVIRQNRKDFEEIEAWLAEERLNS